MAARPTLGDLIAGIQIALTEPIRIEDTRWWSKEN
jgi:small-conductance mechanosensitive channel